MKIVTLLFLSLFPLSAFCSCHEVVPGLFYEHLCLKNPVQSIHVLIADPQQVTIKIGIADNTCASALKTSEIAKQDNAIAAINAGFFDFGCKNKLQDMMTKLLDCFGYSKYKAFPVWVLSINKQYYAISNIFTGVVGWDTSDQRPFFSAVKTTMKLFINDREYVVHELNKPHPKVPTLYLSTYDEKTPFFNRAVDEIVIENNQITQIHRSSRGKRAIPKEGGVYVLPGSRRVHTDDIHVGDNAFVRITHEQKQEYLSRVPDALWDSMDNILASTPLLLCNGAIPEYVKARKSAFYTKRHPRSAVGVLNNGHWVFIVVDGRRKHSKGFTILELAQFMKELGCKDALNLDGGGSSTMVIDNKVVNKPSGRKYSLVKRERPVSNAILVCSIRQ